MKLCAHKQNYCTKTHVCISITCPSLLSLGNLTAPSVLVLTNACTAIHMKPGLTLNCSQTHSGFVLPTVDACCWALPLSNDVCCFLQSETNVQHSCCKQAQSHASRNLFSKHIYWKTNTDISLNIAADMSGLLHIRSVISRACD